MSVGTVFDIKEFAVYDGPGIRTTVFMKGCPLRCRWCHNPEGLSPRPQIMVSTAACTHCGACEKACLHDPCVACGACVPYCPLGLRRISGTEWTDEKLAARLLRDRDFLIGSGGGVTFSGGEPLMQWPFVSDVIDRLDGLPAAVETSGYCTDAVFESAMKKLSLILMDIKSTDRETHRLFTGADPEPILRHARMLAAGSTPFIIRVPVIPNVNDTEKNYSDTAELLAGAASLLRVELLPYHETAGAKYEMVGMEYNPGFDTAKKPYLSTAAFAARGIQARVM